MREDLHGDVSHSLAYASGWDWPAARIGCQPRARQSQVRSVRLFEGSEQFDGALRGGCTHLTMKKSLGLAQALCVPMSASSLPNELLFSTCRDRQRGHPSCRDHPWAFRR
jgi:hypothetical protein